MHAALSAVRTDRAGSIALRLAIWAGAGVGERAQAPGPLHTLVVLRGSSQSSGQAAHRVALEDGVPASGPVDQPCARLCQVCNLLNVVLGAARLSM